MADDRFYVKSLTLENFRCFEKVELGEFDPHFNLIIGENGSGKSSVLLALANLFRPLSWAIEERLSGRLFGPSDARIAGARVRFETVATGVTKPKDWRLMASAVIGREPVSVSEASSDQIFVSLQPELSVRHPRQQSETGDTIWAGSSNESPHLIAFYGVSRKFWERASSARASVSSDQDRDWLTAGTDVGPLREWFRDQTLLALQAEQRKRPASQDGPATQLGLVKRAVAIAYPGTQGAEYDGELMDIIVRFDETRIQSFREMSDGQRALAELVADIARRAFVLNGKRFGAEALERTTGLVLIDEIDLHLHPKWQRQIVPALKRIFPKIQFFATTHSPQVIGEAKPHEIVLLTPQGQRRPPQSFGMDSNWILECVMEAEGRDPAVASRLSALWTMIEDDEIDRARDAIRALRKEIGDAPDLIGAEAYIWRLENLGEEAAE